MNGLRLNVCKAVVESEIKDRHYGNDEDEESGKSKKDEKK